MSLYVTLSGCLFIRGYVYVIDRTKLKQTVVDCEYLKRCCESLTEENRTLQKEVKELRALKTSSPFCMQLPATTLTMCPSCERVATSSSQPSTSAAHIDLSTSSFHSPLIPVKPGPAKQVSWKHVRNKWLSGYSLSKWTVSYFKRRLANDYPVSILFSFGFWYCFWL